MNNKLSLSVLILNTCAIALLFFFQFRSVKKIVYIDSAKVINGYQGMLDARSEYKTKFHTWQANIDTLESEVRREMAKYEADHKKMTAKEKNDISVIIEHKKRQLSEYERAITEKAKMEDMEATKKVIGEINDFLKSYGEANSFTIVLGATEFGNIAYAEQHLDITEDVIKEINKRYAGK